MNKRQLVLAVLKGAWIGILVGIRAYPIMAWDSLKKGNIRLAWVHFSSCPWFLIPVLALGFLLGHVWLTLGLVMLGGWVLNIWLLRGLPSPLDDD